MGVYLAIYDAIVTKLTTAQGSTLSMVKQILQGNRDQTISDSTPLLIVMPESNEDEEFTAMPTQKTARLRVVVRCVAGEKEVNNKTAVRGALELAELVSDALDADAELAGTVELSNVFIRPFENVGSAQNKFAWDVVIDTQKQFTAGSR